jgi:NADPH-dependent glutamate synthase beta subunit-like oxidoreductase
MPEPFAIPSEARHVVAIIGGAVAGSEAAAVCAQRGVTAIVIEQNDRPFGKIEDGLPRWHDKLRQKEYEQIGRHLSSPNVLFVPRTRVGRDVSIAELRDTWGVSAIVLANGAWRDRPLFEGAERYLGRGLVNQNPFVYWYNHYPDQDFAGESYPIVDGAIVVGGGLASIDVVKIVNFELYKRALAARGIRVTTLELEHDGIPQTLSAHGLSQAELGVQGVTLFYRREKTAMPIVQPPDNATPQQLEKTAQVRAKLMDKVIEKCLVNFAPNHALKAPIVEDGRLVGLTFQRTETVQGKLVPRAGDVIDVRSQLIISSIGSIPLPIAGLPVQGELIDFESFDNGKVRGFDNMFGLGNVLTGKGNIKESRKNAIDVGGRLVSDYLFGSGLAAQAVLQQAVHDAAERAIDIAQTKEKLSPAAQQNAYECVQAQWQRTGYAGDYAAWLAAHAPQGEET